MKRKEHKRVPLTEEEQKRLLELKFYYFIKHLQNTLGHSAKFYNTVEHLANLSEIDPVRVKRLAADIVMKLSQLKPTQYEYEILLWRNDKLSLRNILSIAGTNGSRFYKELTFSIRNEIEYTPKAPMEVYITIECFMDGISYIHSWDTERMEAKLC